MHVPCAAFFRSHEVSPAGTMFQMPSLNVFGGSPSPSKPLNEFKVVGEADACGCSPASSKALVDSEAARGEAHTGGATPEAQIMPMVADVSHAEEAEAASAAAAAALTGGTEAASPAAATAAAEAASAAAAAAETAGAAEDEKAAAASSSAEAHLSPRGSGAVDAEGPLGEQGSGAQRRSVLSGRRMRKNSSVAGSCTGEEDGCKSVRWDCPSSSESDLVKKARRHSAFSVKDLQEPLQESPDMQHTSDPGSNVAPAASRKLVRDHPMSRSTPSRHHPRLSSSTGGDAQEVEELEEGSTEAGTSSLQDSGVKKESPASRRHQLRKTKSAHMANPRRRASRGNLLLATETIEQLNENDDGATRTTALLKSISEQMQSESNRTFSFSGKPAHSISAPPTQPSTSSAIPSSEASLSIPFLSQAAASASYEASSAQVVASDPPPHATSGEHFCYQPSAHAKRVRKASSSVVQSLDAPLEGNSQGGEIDEAPQDSAAGVGGGAMQENALPGSADGPLPEDGKSIPHAPASGSGPPAPPSQEASRDNNTLQPIAEAECQPATWSFDILVSVLRPVEGKRSPLLVIICNSTEHSQVRATLSTLAESQLILLSSIMPQHAVQFLATESSEAVPEHVGQLARAHKGVTLLFMDIVGFTSMSKVETAGDCYIVSGGIMSPRHSTREFGLVVEDQDPVEAAARVLDFAKAMLEAAKQVKMPDTNEPVRVRVGLHTGDVVSGLIGSKLPKFSIFGDTMNTASRMESTGLPGRIHVSETTQRLLPSEVWESSGGVEVKGKGHMQTYFLALQPPAAPSQPTTLESSREGLPSCTLFKRTQDVLRQFSTPAPTPVPSYQYTHIVKQLSTPPMLTPAMHLLGEEPALPVLASHIEEVSDHLGTNHRQQGNPAPWAQPFQN
ncbi:hypothetical protein DUNSADRAFT_3657 [Dunaliella salina]|uniref:Guanylate cyclase domain-containing protein n=1 Tax=Dunaliella salina TaxID=3046 RepID=A0ABQ7GTL3_DUNSA|nr:hypothetical protein DUNSADRAFT_3657 [Dunaliella salina]|eukprot:KAF5837936.1 hypothetical protein DUNSADRAFT_3657 [Dunaliella salina]